MDNKIPNRVAAAIIFLGAASRLLPHPPNVTPLTAMALLGGAMLAPKAAFALPLLALALSDLVLGLHPTLPFVYASFLAAAWLGTRLKENPGAGKVALACLASSVLFFVVTNFGVWLATGMYSRDFSGLVACYSAAIPFFRNSILGDGLFTGLLFGMNHLSLRVLTPRTATA